MYDFQPYYPKYSGNTTTFPTNKNFNSNIIVINLQ